MTNTVRVSQNSCNFCVSIPDNLVELFNPHVFWEFELDSLERVWLRAAKKGVQVSVYAGEDHEKGDHRFCLRKKVMFFDPFGFVDIEIERLGDDFTFILPLVRPPCLRSNTIPLAEKKRAAKAVKDIEVAENAFSAACERQQKFPSAVNKERRSKLWRALKELQSAQVR